MNRLLLCTICLAFAVTAFGCGSNKGVEMPKSTTTHKSEGKSMDAPKLPDPPKG